MTAATHATRDATREKFVRAGGNAEVYDQLVTRYGDETDVPRWAEWAIDFRRHKPVSNLNGVLISKVREEAAKETGRPSMSAEQRRLEAERYAAFQVQLYQIISEQGLAPNRVADMLEHARRNGYPHLNAAVIERLRLCGTKWPGA